MAHLPKKTYSRHNALSVLSDREKENTDPFDELLSSPLKQDVQFKPLSFWGKKVKNFDSRKKSNRVKYKLYETSDSDDHNSPFQRKRKHKFKCSVSKTTVHTKSTYGKFSSRRDNDCSTAYSLTDTTQFHKFFKPNKCQNFEYTKEFVKKYICLDKTSYPDVNIKKTFKSANEVSDNFKYKSTEFFNIDDTNDSSCLQSIKPEENDNINARSISRKIFNPNNLKLKLNEDHITLMQEPKDAYDKTVVSEEESVNNAMQFSESMNGTLTPFYKDHDTFKFISLKRHFNYPCFYTLHDDCYYCSSNTVKSNEHSNCLNQSLNVSRSSCHNNSGLETYKDVNMMKNHVNNAKKTNLHYDNDYFISDALEQTCNESMDKTHCSVDCASLITEDSEAIYIKEKCLDENTFSDNFGFIPFKNYKTEDVIQELLEQQNVNLENSVTTEYNSTSDDTLSETNDEDTAIRIGLKPKINSSLDLAMKEEIICSVSPLREVLQLTDKISDLTMSPTTEPSESKTGKSSMLQVESKCGDEESSFIIDLKNVTTKRRGFLNNSYDKDVARVKDNRSSMVPREIQKEKNSEIEFKFDETLELPSEIDRMSLDWNKTISFSNPMFESTRVLDVSLMRRKMSQEQPDSSKTILEESGLDHVYALKPGKKWFRSISVLKQFQNRNISEKRAENSRIKGRKFESFVQDMIKMQNATFKVSNKTFDFIEETKVQNSLVSGLNRYEAVLNFESSSEDASEISEFFSINDSMLTNSVADKRESEKLLLNRTVKVIQPEEGSSAFRSALGLETSHILIQENSVQEESSCVAARNFILNHCGQEDVLPFEEYFNERTLINCKKIGEGVYGEVFMCSDVVIKIIPIEGSDKVNGEFQKTFEEIISEVVIASKLSSLRNGEKYRTDGFSELKRCWCVKGKYPNHLLRLWNEYDQLGSGSENDSPVMFKDDQLYIILELLNGGKDLESFVFNSASQSLSILIQAAFSLAAAEKAFEFEHRDLHWGNVLISETKDKFMTVVLDGSEYKIPTKGVKVCIIDFTLSRISHEGCCIFNDLSVDPGLFVSEGDYQFEIYRMMLREVRNDWSLFRPKNNLFWLHYMLDKMLIMVRYKNKKGKIHTKHLKDLKTLELTVLEFKNSADFVLNSSLNIILGNL